MKSQPERNSGIALIAGSLLLMVTMLLHPAGGNIQYLQNTVSIIIVSHSIALLTIPFIFVGFWGLTKKLGTDNFISLIAFPILLFGLIAGMIAAAINGLALPIFVQNYKEATPDIIGSLKPTLKFILSLNQAFDFIYIGAMCLSTLFWSVAILLTKKIPAWLGYLGMVLSLIAIVMLTSGFVFINLHGFRLFILGNIIWTILIGIILMRSHVYTTKIAIDH